LELLFSIQPNLADFEEKIMKLSAPKNITFYIAVGLALIGFIGFFVAAMNVIAPWLVLAGFVVLAAGNLLENL